MVVDDLKLFRVAVGHATAEDPLIELVGEAADGVEAEEVFRACRPDVVLLDLVMPRRDGLATLRRLRSIDRRCHIVMLTTREDDEAVATAMRLGARGYLLKDVTPEGLLRALHGLRRGEVAIPHRLAARLPRNLAAEVPEDDETLGAGAPLSPREREVLELVRKGHTNQEIAAHMALSLSTVNKHVQSILRKLGARNRTEAIRLA